MKKVTLLRCIEAFGISTLGMVVAADGWRMAERFRAAGGFGVVGPDRYLFGIGICLIAMAIIYLAFGSEPPAQDATEDRQAESIGDRRAVLYAGAAVAYAALLPVIGFVTATLVFFVAAFRIGDRRRWWHCIVAGTVATVACFVLFVVIAGVEFPEAMFLPR